MAAIQHHRDCGGGRQLDVAREIAARHPDFRVHRVTLDEPMEADPDAAEDNLGELFVRSPRGTVAVVVTKKSDYPIPA
jgi:hypothetical protein